MIRSNIACGHKVSARVIEVVQVTEDIYGDNGKVIRQIVSYWTKEGERIGSADAATGQSESEHIRINEQGEVVLHY